jgi:tetratricopeptide (TPR) repeat protein
MAAEEDIKMVFKLAPTKDEAYYHHSQCILNYAAGVSPETTLPDGRRQEVSADTAPYKDWNYTTALAEVNKAIQINPLPLYYQHQANLYSLQKDYAQAYAAYQKVNASSMASPSSFYAASRLVRLMNDTTSMALSLMDSCIAHFPKPFTQEAAPYLYERAEMLMQIDSLAAALADYEAYEAAVGGELNALFYYQRAQLAGQLKNYDKALSDIQKALKTLPEDPTLLEEQASILVTTARYVEAITSLNLALRKEANRPYALRLKGYSLLQLGEQEEAKTVLTAAKDLDDTVAAQLLERYFQE